MGGWPDVVVVAVVLGSALGATRMAQTSVGTAVELSGDWFVQGNDGLQRKIERGRELSAGALIRPPKSSAEGTFLAILYRDGLPVRFECPRDCRGTLRLKTEVRADANSTWTSMWSRMQQLFWGNEPRYRAAITRGGGEPRDGVLRMRGDRADLTPILAGAPRGRYLVRIRNLAAGTPAPASPGETILEWEGADSAQPATVSLSSGLYRVELRPAAPATAGPPIVAWALALDEPAYTRASTAFDAARAVASDWSGEVGAGTRVGLLRALLDSLAAEHLR